MASDSKEFARALAKWDSLQEAREYSVRNGEVAVMYSGRSFEEGDVDAFTEEAYQLLDAYKEIGMRPFVVDEFTLDDVADVFRDRSVSDIVMIGHGTISAINIVDDKYPILDWRHISLLSDHLKTGMFVQRHCGKFNRALNVSLGSFAMRSHDRVLAPANKYLPLRTGVEDELLIRRFNTLQRLTYYDVKTKFNNGDEPEIDIAS